MQCTEFEECLVSPSCWVDAVSTVGNSIQITEWKNIPLDFVFVKGKYLSLTNIIFGGGEWNRPNISSQQDLAEAKANALRYKDNDLF